jgi:cytochrome b pre-mRNA-processing protein 3
MGMESFFRRWVEQAPDRAKVAALYGQVMAAARHPAFFGKFTLSDNFETRFDLLVVHMFLILTRLKREGQRALMRALTEYMVDDLDRSLREMGIGDVGVAKRMKKLMSAFYGRVVAYEKAMASTDEKEILRALDRNLFAASDTDLPRLTSMRAYLWEQQKRLAALSLMEITDGREIFSNAALP